MMFACRGLHTANINNSSLSACNISQYIDIAFLFIFMEQFVLLRRRTNPEWDIRVTNVVQTAPELALTIYWFSNFLVHKSISETVCSSASWHAGQKSKLTLFTAQLSNFDGNISFLSSQRFLCLSFQSDTISVYGCRGVFVVAPAPEGGNYGLCFKTWFISDPEEIIVCVYSKLSQTTWSPRCWGGHKTNIFKQEEEFVHFAIEASACIQTLWKVPLSKNASQLRFPRCSSISFPFAPDITH